jgi:hypothetical protein
MSYNNEYSSNNNDEYSSTVCPLLFPYLDRASYLQSSVDLSSLYQIPLFTHVNHHFFQAFVSNCLICRVAKVVSMTEPLAQMPST